MRITLISVILSCLLLNGFASVDYTNSGSDWVEATCVAGQRQSPINIITSKVKDNYDIELTIDMNNITSGTIHHDLNELKVTYTNGSLMYESDYEISTWTPAQFHFHAPSEHTIDVTSYDLEMHTVFTNNDDSSQYLVIGILWEEDASAEDDPFITSLNMTGISESTHTITDVNMSGLFSWVNKQKKYNYKGSLTTPTCNEAVEWMVVTKINKINSQQLDLFTSLWADNNAFAAGKGTNREIKPLHRREVQLIGASKSDWDWVWPVVIALIVLSSICF